MMNNPMQLISMLSQSPNPNMLMQQLLGQNPVFSQVMSMVRGKNPQELEQFVRNSYKTQGKDLNEIAKQFGFNITA